MEPKKKYTETIKADLKKGFIEKMSQNYIQENDNKKNWYLPHHPVFHPYKPGKVRRACNAASKYQGTSLNDNLLSGPDLLQKLVGTLFKFREGAVALTADIEQIILLVKVKENDTHSLKFLYSDVEIENERTVIYKYNRRIFDARSSAICANYALTRTLEIDNLHQLSNHL